MAHLVLISVDTTHNAATACRDALVAGGHTVDLVSDAAALGGHDFAPYDAILTSRPDMANGAALAPLLIDLNRAGKPLIVGPMEAGLAAGGAQTNNILVHMALAASVRTASSQTNVSVGSPSDHPIRGTVPTGSNALFASGNWITGLTSMSVGTGFIAGTASWVNGNAVAVAINPGAILLNGLETGQRIVVFPTYLLSAAYTADHRTLLLNAVDWALAGTYAPPPPDVKASRLVGYAVLDFPADRAGASRLVGYAVMNEDALRDPGEPGEPEEPDPDPDPGPGGTTHVHPQVLDLRFAARVFWGGIELREIWRDGQRFWLRPN